MTTLADAVSAAERRLIGAGVAPREAALDVEVLVRHALGWDRARYLSRRREPLPASFSPRFEPLVRRRCRREPVAQITGSREFWGLALEVTRAVLTPRPESELLIESALGLLGDRTAPWMIADVGTGSGCLAIALAVELPQAGVTATDTSDDALAVARRNAATHGVADRVSCHATRFLDGLPGPYDLIVSNPPYVATGELATLPPEVARYEPAAALSGGADGLDPARELVGAAAARLRPDGWLVMEIGAGQRDAIQEIVRRAGLALVAIHPDLRGIPRAVVMRRA